MTRAGRPLVLALGLLGLAAGPALAQTVEFRQGRGGLRRADEALARVLSRGRYRVLTRDTVLAEGAAIHEDVILLGATLRVEGRIAGDLIGVQSDIFARPGGRFDGAVAILGGGFYGSELAKVETPPIIASTFDYRVERREGEGYLITAPGARVALRAAGIYGFLLPRYDRVSALTVAWGLDLEGVERAGLPEGSARLRFRSAPADVDGEVELRWTLGRHAVALRVGRTVRSNDAWINGDPENSLYALVLARDVRNYYQADFAEAELRLEHGARSLWSHGLLIAWERARPLTDRDPFSIFSIRGGFRPNLRVERSDLVSLGWESALDLWVGPLSSLHVEASVEGAHRDLAGDLSFTLFAGALRLDLPGFARGSIRIEARGQLPSSDAPPQRWRALGAWGTLPTLRPLARVGDRMWWTRATYRLPTGVTLDGLGDVAVWLQYAAGNAWTRESRRSTAHDVGLGLSLGRLMGGVYTDPSADFETTFALGLSP